jgi:hypothetical protein
LKILSNPDISDQPFKIYIHWTIKHTNFLKTSTITFAPHRRDHQHQSRFRLFI